MLPPYLTDKAIKHFIKEALHEDIGDGDHSTLASIPESSKQTAKIIAKGEGIMAGAEMAGRIYDYFDKSIRYSIHVKDGESFSTGDVLLTVDGSARSILTTERLVLNCMQRMCGIATTTRRLSDLIKGTKARILDTRKTTPNFRLMEKWAVYIGGGENHRYGLYDMIMLKDNHIDYAGGITRAVSATVHYLEALGKDLRIEVETRNLEEVREALETDKVDVIMLDNMMPSDMKQAVILINGKCETEASGGITEKTIVEVAESGVDFISIGALTHSAGIIDLSMLAS